MPASGAGVVALLLAAGESRRMARPKALLPWHGTTLIQHQVFTLQAAGIERIIVVLGHRPEALEKVLAGTKGVCCVLNPNYLQGKTTSIKAGLNALGPEPPRALLILNVDQPREASTIRYLVQQHRQGICRITIPTYGGKRGHPILLDPSLLGELLSIDEETLGLKAVVERHQDTAQRVEMASREVLLDLNTPEQYRAAVRAKNQDPATAGS